MATQKAVDDLQLIRQGLAGNKLVVGMRRTLHNLALGQLSAVFIASNCPEALRAKARHDAALAKASLHELSIPSGEFAALCKKQYNILLAGLQK